jgi:aminoglycoside phosphotransferase family enzyme
VAEPGTSGLVPVVLAFLSRADSYPERPSRVQVIETHMSWVFLLDRRS